MADSFFSLAVAGGIALVTAVVTGWILARYWKRIRLYFGFFKTVRFGLIIVAVLIVAAVLLPQWHEILLNAAEEFQTGGRTQQIYWLVFATSSCGIAVWYWSRVLFYLTIDNDQASSDEGLAVILREHLPRVLGLLVFLAVALALAVTATESGVKIRLWATATALIVLGALGYYLAMRRVKIFKLKRPTGHIRSFLDLFGQSPTSLYLVVFLWAASGLLTLLFAQWPETVAPPIGSGGIVLFALASIMSVGSLLVYWGDRFHFPAVTGALVLAIGFSLFNDNHLVRQTAVFHSHDEPAQTLELSTSPLDNFKTLDAYFADWVKGLQEKHENDQPIPVVIIATEGGGIRAAYWTAAVLGELQDRAGDLDFGRHIFAISGVSGGSLGAAVFSAQRAADIKGASFRTSDECNREAKSVRQRVTRVLAADFLAPTVASMLFPDLIQRFLPLPAVDDRAMAMEKSWEKAWSDCEMDQTRFSEPFDKLWDFTGDADEEKRFRVPLLFLNSTVVKTGQRMIASPLPFEPGTAFHKVFHNALETRRELGTKAPLSTVVHTSARFTYVSPAGTIRRLDRKDSKLAVEPRWIRVVDGGYFENSGAVTANEILARIAMLDARSNSPRKIRPIVIHISNEPVTKPKSRPQDASGKRAFMSEVLSPLWALLNVRPARGYQAREQLAREVANMAGGAHYHFRLCETEGTPPLSWQLSKLTEEKMDKQLPRMGGAQPKGAGARHQKYLDEILKILTGKAALRAETVDDIVNESFGIGWDFCK